MSYLLQQPRLRQIPHYIVYKGIFDAAQCDSLIAMGTDMQPALVGAEPENARVDRSVRSTRVRWIAWSSEVDWVFSKLAAICDDVRQNWLPFHLSGFTEPLQLTNYRASEGGHYGVHRDMGNDALSVRKLSLIAHLSDPADFDGGALRLPGVPGDDKSVAETERGTVIALPSYELHEVTPVTRGERWSLVAWVHGPPFS